MANKGKIKAQYKIMPSRLKNTATVCEYHNSAILAQMKISFGILLIYI